MFAFKFNLRRYSAVLQYNITWSVPVLVTFEKCGKWCEYNGATIRIKLQLTTARAGVEVYWSHVTANNYWSLYDGAEPSEVAAGSAGPLHALANGSFTVGLGIYCSPRHMMPFSSRHDGYNACRSRAAEQPFDSIPSGDNWDRASHGGGSSVVTWAYEFESGSMQVDAYTDAAGNIIEALLQGTGEHGRVFVARDERRAIGDGVPMRRGGSRR